MSLHRQQRAIAETIDRSGTQFVQDFDCVQLPRRHPTLMAAWLETTAGIRLDWAPTKSD